MVNVPPLFKILQEAQGNCETMRMKSESGTIIIKHEISGHMNKYELLKNKTIYFPFL